MFVCISFFIPLRASILVDVKLCKIQKATNFIHVVPKDFHISLSKTVYIYTCATVTVHICTVTVDVYLIILFINFTFAPFFLSLLRAQQTQWLLLSSNTHKHTHAQTHPHKQINTKIHKHTHTDKPIERQIVAWLEWSVLVGQREWVLRQLVAEMMLEAA